MNKNLRNLIGAIRCKTILYANMAKAQRTLSILTDYTKPTAKMLLDMQFRPGVAMPTFFRLEREINRIYEIEAQTEDYIRGESMKLKLKKVVNLLQTAATENDANATLTAIKQSIAFGVVKADEELTDLIWSLTYDREASGWIDYRTMEVIISPVFYRGQDKHY